jgi:uncharacterized protein
MILVHVHQYLELPVTGLEDLISSAIWIGAEQKSWATFAFLFGVGFAVQLRRMEAKGLPVTQLYLRRLLVLALFGIAAHALFGFRILLDYALWGVPLLFMRRWTTRSLLLAALISVSARSLIDIAFGPHNWRVPESIASALRAAETQSSYAVLFDARLQEIRAEYLTPSFLVPGVNLALFIFGFVALRGGLFDNPKQHTRLIVELMLLGLLSWAAYWLVFDRLDPGSLPPRIGVPLQNGFGIVRDQWLAFTYIGGLVLLLAYRPVWERRLSAFALVGRMALTNYLLQIAVLDVLSSGYGFGLRVRPLLVPLVAALVFALEVAFSRFWLARYRLGPAEWLWRSLTYGKRQPLRD